MNITPWTALPDWVSHGDHWYVLSDTHGRLEPFRELLSAAPEGARLIHLGDIADRGHQPYECYQEIAARPDMTLVMGNHDMMAWKVLFDLEMPMRDYVIWMRLWMRNSGSTTMKAISEIDDREDLVKSVLDRQKLYHFDGNLFFVHSGLFPEDDFQELAGKEDIETHELSEYELFHLTWRADDDPRFWDRTEGTTWTGFPVKPFFVHGHRRCSRTHAREFTGICEKSLYLPREDTWRLGVDSSEGMTALEIKDGKYRFYDIDGAPF